MSRLPIVDPNLPKPLIRKIIREIGITPEEFKRILENL